jgi:hypothetical protein
MSLLRTPPPPRAVVCVPVTGNFLTTLNSPGEVAIAARKPAGAGAIANHPA